MEVSEGEVTLELALEALFEGAIPLGARGGASPRSGSSGESQLYDGESHPG